MVSVGLPFVQPLDGLVVLVNEDLLMIVVRARASSGAEADLG